jgi:two-component system chemotaxis response regulator CheB
MPPFFTKLLAERLSSKSNIEVFEDSPGVKLEPGKAWIAPGDFHMVLSRKGTDIFLETNQEPPENSCRPAVDVLFRSVVKLYRGGGRTRGVVITGMGQDGLIGSEIIKDAGGQVVVQDEASSVVWGMPGFVTKADLADKILPLNQVGPEIIRRLKTGQTF